MRFCVYVYISLCLLFYRNNQSLCEDFLVNNQTVTYLVMVIIFGSVVLFCFKNPIKTIYD
jgi:hypothetical protein